MTIKAYIFVVSVMLFSLMAKAQVYDGNTTAQIELNEVLDQIKPGTILVVGEMHGLKPVHDQQMSILQGLRDRGLTVSTGMEFFNYTDQSLIQSFRSGDISQADFKKAINWGAMDFSLYGPQLLFGDGGIGLNMPRSVTSTISKNGLAALSPEQQALMPPNFELGNDGYKRRFLEAMGGHMAPEKFANYFAAQSVWDETMAWQALEFMKKNKDHVFVIIVGEFHVAYGGGLPDRLQSRMNQMEMCQDLKIKTISQIYTEDMTAEDLQTAIAPSAVDGKRADFIMLAHPM
jgi:uncharacterized iron-regulated protein